MSKLDSQKATLLVVDDNPTNLKVISNILEEEGLDVRLAMDGNTALQQVEIEPPDLILLDVLMPEMSGYETCERLKLNPATNDIPIIFMTALSETTDKVRGFEVGAVDYITKPFQQPELLARVKVHLELRSLRKVLEEKNRILEQLTTDLENTLKRERKLSRTDSLTGIGNRAAFYEVLNEFHLPSNYPLTIVYIDCDNFKQVNDTLGHATGDELLKEVAKIVVAKIRQSDMAARLGGDEFAIILPATEAEQAMFVISRLRDALLNSMEKRNWKVTFSIGITTFCRSILLEDMMRKADETMYKVKKHGKNAISQSDFP